MTHNLTRLVTHLLKRLVTHILTRLVTRHLKRRVTDFLSVNLARLIGGLSDILVNFATLIGSLSDISAQIPFAPVWPSVQPRNPSPIVFVLLSP